jgi:hypothetical protein
MSKVGNEGNGRGRANLSKPISEIKEQSGSLRVTRKDCSLSTFMLSSRVDLELKGPRCSGLKAASKKVAASKAVSFSPECQNMSDFRVKVTAVPSGDISKRARLGSRVPVGDRERRLSKAKSKGERGPRDLGSQSQEGSKPSTKPTVISDNSGLTSRL